MHNTQKEIEKEGLTAMELCAATTCLADDDRGLPERIGLPWIDSRSSSEVAMTMDGGRGARRREEGLSVPARMAHGGVAELPRGGVSA